MSTAAANLHEAVQHLARRFDISLKLQEKPTPGLLATGIPALNIPRGTLTEFFGSAASGKTSLLIGALAQTTRRPEFCALIDAADSFDPASAEEQVYIYPHLLWIRCGGNVEAALKAVDLLAHAGGFGMVALDLAGVSMQQARRIPLASWFRLRHAVRGTLTALVVVENELNAHSCSTLQIEHRSIHSEIRGKLLRGIAVSVTVGPRQIAVSELEFHQLYHV